MLLQKGRTPNKLSFHKMSDLQQCDKHPEDKYIHMCVYGRSQTLEETETNKRCGCADRFRHWVYWSDLDSTERCFDCVLNDGKNYKRCATCRTCYLDRIEPTETLANIHLILVFTTKRNCTSKKANKS